MLTAGFRWGSKTRLFPNSMIGGWWPNIQSFFFIGNWKRLKMIRTSLSQLNWKSQPDEKLAGMQTVFDLNEIGTTIRDKEGSIVSVIESDVYGDLRDRTLTLKSELIAELDWKRSTIRPLEVLAKDGEVMAMTLRWMDGVGNPENTRIGRTGKGQLILLANTARKRLEEHFEPISIDTRIMQHFESGEEKISRSYFNGLVDAA